MPYSASDLRKGLKLRYEGQPYTITEYSFTKPGKGQSIYTCRLKHMLTGNTFVKNFREIDTFEELDLEEKTVNFSYEDGDQFVFLDADSEQINVPADILGDKKYFLEDDLECKILFLDGNPVEVTFPTFVERKIEWCDAGAKGNTAAGKVMKNCRVAGGYELKCPIFVNEGDWIRIDTRTGEYADRIMGRSGLEKLYLRYCYELGYLPKCKQNPTKLHMVLKEDLLKCDQYSEQAKLLAKYHVSTEEDLLKTAANIKGRMAELGAERDELRRAARRVLPEDEKGRTRESIKVLTEEIRQLRHELKVCDEIHVRSAHIEENLRIVDADRRKERERKESR